MRTILRCEPANPTRYRYLLQVAVTSQPTPDDRSLTVILKNPSIADATRGDPTTGKVEAWARQHGISIVTYLNLFALRSPYPRTINQHSYHEAVGPENDAVLNKALNDASHDGRRWTIDDAFVSTVHRLLSNLLVIAWGNPNGIDPVRYQQRISEVRVLIERAGMPVHNVGELTKLGYPRHGLQWRVGMSFEKL